jgi:hypothetical protein
LATLAIVRTSAAQADALFAELPPKLPGELLSALNDLSDANDQFRALNKATDDALAGRPISAGSQWEHLAEQWEDAVSRLVKAPLPSEFKPVNTFTLQDITSCAQANQTNQKLVSYVGELESAHAQAQLALNEIHDFLSQIPKIDQALTHLQSVYDQLIRVPIYGELFEADVFDLIKRLPDALDAAKGALEFQEKPISDDLALLTNRVLDYRANVVSLLAYRAKLCGIAGPPVGPDKSDVSGLGK